jgi:hypothetical protein
MNPWSTPGGMLLLYPPDESSNLRINYRPAEILMPWSKAPEQTKAGAMPRDNGFWFDDYQDIIPFRLEPAEQNPKHPIPHS